LIHVLFWQKFIFLAWSWTILLVGAVYGECHAPCTLKTTFVDFEKKSSMAHCSNYRTLNILSLPNSLYLSSSSQYLLASSHRHIPYQTPRDVLKAKLHHLGTSQNSYKNKTEWQIKWFCIIYMNVFLNEFCKLFFLFYFPDAMVQIEWTLIIKGVW
jgi:hypothetical protein